MYAVQFVRHRLARMSCVMKIIYCDENIVGMVMNFVMEFGVKDYNYC